MPTKQVVFTPAAVEDLDNIWLEIAFDNVGAADKTVDRIERRTSQLSTFPESGRKRPEVADEVRSLAVGNYLILYKVEAEVTVVRIVHGARDITALL